MKIYISGKVSGLPFDEVYKKFDEAEQKLISQGFETVNPVKLVEQIEGATWEYYMEKDIALLLRCQAIYLLSDWGSSKGARTEYAIAKELELQIQFQK